MIDYTHNKVINNYSCNEKMKRKNLLITKGSQILQYFGNMRHNSTALNAFTMVVKMTNHTGL